MSSDIHRNHYQALVIPEDRFEPWPEQTTVLPKGPHTAQPVASVGSRMVLRTVREDRINAWDATDGTVEVVAHVGGLPALTSAPAAAGYRWRFTGDGDDEWRGWDRPYVFHGYQSVDVEVAVGATKYKNPHAVAADGGLIIVYEGEAGAGPDGWIVTKRYLADSTTIESRSTTGRAEGAAGTDACPCLVRDEFNRIIRYYAQSTASGVVVSADVSADEGSTWTSMSGSVLPAPLANPVTRLRAATRPGSGQFVLLVTSNGDTVHYASSDGGYHFESVTTLAGVTLTDIEADATTFHVVWKATTIQYGTLTSAWDTLASTESIGAHGDDTYGLGLTITEDGVLYVYGAAGTFASTDSGRSWGSVGAWWSAGSSPLTYAGSHPSTIAVEAFDARVVMLCGHVADVATIDKSIGLLDFGGYSTITSPLKSSLDLAADQRSWPTYWLPIDKPGDMGWDVTGSMSVESINSGVLRLSDTSGSSITYSTDSGSDVVYEGAGEFRVLTSSKKSGAAPEDRITFLECQEADAAGIHQYRVRITVESDSIWVGRWDGATWIEVESATIDATGGLDVKWAFYSPANGGEGTPVSGHVRVWCRAVSAFPSGPWVEVANAAVADIGDGTVDAGGMLDSHVSWGANTDAGDVVEFHSLVWGTATTIDYSFASRWLDFTNPDHLLPRPFSSRATRIADHVSITAAGGPCDTGDTWSIGTAFDFPVANLSDPSPRRAFKHPSTGMAGRRYVAWKLSDQGDARLGSDVLAIVLHEHNLPLVEVGLWIAGGTPHWVQYDIDLTTGPVGYRRDGDTVAPSTGGTKNPLVRMAEFDGCTFQFGTDKARRIVSTREGKWKTGTTQTPTFALEGVDGTEAASGTDGTIVPRTSVILLSVAGLKFTGIRIGLPDPDDGEVAPPVDDEWSIGVAFPGLLIVHPEMTDWSRTIETTANVTVDEIDGGYRRSRKRGPERRTVTFALTDAVDSLYASKDTDDPRYHALGWGVMALDRTSAWQFEGVLRALDGPNKCLLYIPRFDDTEAGQWVLNRRHQMVYGRLTSPVRLEVVLGEEGESEVFRIATMSVSEEV